MLGSLMVIVMGTAVSGDVLVGVTHTTAKEAT